MKGRLALAIAVAMTVPGLAYAHGIVRTDAELMAVLRTAAPAKIVENATVMNMAADGTMKVIQKGTNGWTCMDPGTHDTGEPMCADAAAMAWAEAGKTRSRRLLQLASCICSTAIAA